ncbi:MarR family winged helix-turn-helix transcriptional regulator [Vallitalea okinawensis]|uniref:MarR family winged helix-turn-helix transcriptional regulator n=1 Tax=Vallitalea okinawensis TaxID=2078660 RepID=UPI000CFDB86F|nr:MarR family transcriptional regulator [Vallitalea okinawensis]
MEKNIEKINNLLVDIFDSILLIEEKALKNGEIKDLSITEYHTIVAIGLDRSRTMSEVAKDLNITVGTLTTAINRLVKKGYVDRRREETDRRIVKIFLTEKGKVAFKNHEKFHEEMIQSMLKDIKIDHQYLLIKSLTNINEYLHYKYKK